MGKYRELCEKALEAMGGLENITYVTNCATRLRINYAKKSLVDEEALKNLPGSAGLVPKPANKQYQIIIGPNVRDAYYEFLDVSGWKDNGQAAPKGADDPIDDEEPAKKDIIWVLNKFGSFMTPIMMPVVPAMIVGGMILAFRNLLMNYFGMKFEGGTYWMVMAIFNAGFNFLPIYIGWQTADQLRIKPILGGMLGALLLSSYLPQVTDIFGIPVTQTSYGSTVLPVLLGCLFMAPIYKFWNKVIPEALSFFVVPILTMIIVVPVELLVIGPIGQMLSGYIATFATWITSKANVIAQPILSMLYPYMVMIGLDKGLSPIGLELLATLGYNSVTAPMGFVSNIAVGGSCLAVASEIKNDVEKRGMIASFGVTALCGVTEPAFYGGLLTKPIALAGTAIGAAVGGLIAGIVGLRTFVQGGCPGWLTLVFFIDTNGNAKYMIYAIIVAAVTTVVSFLAAKALLTLTKKKEA
jgi:PTS system beta-glucosides-specific IIC component